MVVVPLMVLGIAVLTWMVDRLQQSFEQLRALGARLQTVREEERRRIAREIHDDLGQILIAIKLALISLVSELPKRYRRSNREEAIVKLVDGAISSSRRNRHGTETSRIGPFGSGRGRRMGSRGVRSSNRDEVPFATPAGAS
jgi:signal transduction histidine kinase